MAKLTANRPSISFWFLPTFVSVALLLAVWLFAIGPGGLQSWILASPEASIGAVLAQPEYFFFHAGGTLTVIFWAVTLSLLVGVLLGAVSAVCRQLSTAIWAALVLAQALPIFALGPVVAVLIGASLLKSVVVASLILVFPVALSLHRGMKAIDRDLVDAGRLDAPNVAVLFTNVLWPLSLPSLMGGVRAASTIAPMAAFIGELAGTERGLSRIIAREMSMGRTDMVWGAVLIMIFMAFGLFAVSAIVERLVVPWSFFEEDK